MMEESDEMENLRIRTEERFFEMLEKGEDIRIFLFFPYDMLSENVKEYLDNYVLLKAYDNLEKSSDPEDFVVFDEMELKVTVDEPENRLELLERMITHFLKKEEYEKCAKIQKLIQTLKLKENG